MPGALALMEVLGLPLTNRVGNHRATRRAGGGLASWAGDRDSVFGAVPAEFVEERLARQDEEAASTPRKE